MNIPMSIYTKPRNKVIFAFPRNGHDWEIELAKKHLVLGDKYTVKTIIVHGFHTDIILKEVPDVTFSSSQFKNLRKRR